MAINKKFLDRRTLDRYREKGLLKKEDYESFLKNLPDDAANAQWVQMDIHDAELGDGDSGTGDET